MATINIFYHKLNCMKIQSISASKVLGFTSSNLSQLDFSSVYF